MAEARLGRKVGQNMEEMQNEREFITLEDEDGQAIEFELIAQCEENGNRYYAVIPVDAEEENDNEFCEYTILKEIAEEDEISLVSVDDEDEFDAIANIFDTLFSEEIDYDAE
ncbi:MAG: DUF1292 domain-containing protein [Ruminococcaceae bacterium]|nr:DUF1292 domain-containing protein [Oscillospiraceae bacterium]